MIPKPLGAVFKAAAVIVGGLFSAATIGRIWMDAETKRRFEAARTCGVCRGKGFYKCKLCKGNATIEWSPLFDPIAINPCLCPTCDGRRIQRCLNCLGKGVCLL